MKRKHITASVEIELSIEMGAAWFASLDDDGQSRFFVEVARIAANTYDGTPETQWLAIGNHLATCKCATEQGRDMIRGIQYGIDNPVSRHATDLRAKATGSTQRTATASEPH